MKYVIENKRVYFVGDIHGNFKGLANYLKRYGITDGALVFCGDCGFGFNTLQGTKDMFSKRAKLTSLCKSCNIELFFVRGNHDDPSWFNDIDFMCSNIHMVSDYSIISTPQHNILCVGGGLSIDRVARWECFNRKVAEYRRWHKCTTEQAKKCCCNVWWKGEMPVYNEELIDNLGKRIDVVCTHAAPSIAPPSLATHFHYEEVDKNLLTDSNIERATLDDVYRRLLYDGHPLQQWFYGHYHYYNTQVIGGITFNLLDMDRDGNLCVKELI